jgi:D-alanyl-lipoteichoic acid acyltransferase DltB (MBOAT superfamily)
MSLDHLPHWTALFFLLYGAVCVFLAVRTPYIHKIAATRMRPGARQRLLVSRGYGIFVRVIAVFGFVMSLTATWLILSK